jgi:hypothetical protein
LFELHFSNGGDPAVLTCGPDAVQAVHLIPLVWIWGQATGRKKQKLAQGFQTWQKEQTSADCFCPPAEVFGGGKENKFARA